MRITFIIDHFVHELGGTENQIEKMIHGLSSGFEIELISLRSSEWLATRGRDLGCRLSIFQIDNFRRSYTYRNFFRLISHLRATKPDVVHTFFPVANIFGVIAARLAGVHMIVASRRDYGEWMNRRYLLMTRFANLFVARIVTNSNQVKQLTVLIESFPENRIVVIFNGIAMNAFHHGAPKIELRRVLQIPDGHKVVGLIANYRPMKRHETFVRAADAIVRKRDDIDFVLVGCDAVPGEPKKAIQQLVASLGIVQRVHFAHADGNVQDFLSILDVGVNCSEGEGLSNAIMEYMAAEIPCVVSNSGGNPDLITDGVNGYTFALGDHYALARKILRLIDDDTSRQRFTQNAKEKVRNEMNLEAMVSRFTQFYRSLSSPNGRVAKIQS
jgi:glycosyltransferase involved in cell wall biosynthesis